MDENINRKAETTWKYSVKSSNPIHLLWWFPTAKIAVSNAKNAAYASEHCKQVGGSRGGSTLESCSDSALSDWPSHFTLRLDKKNKLFD